MSKIVGIDLGASNTRIHMKGRGIVLREPSMVVTENVRKKILAVGDEAQKILGKTQGSFQVQRPLVNGVIADYGLTLEMMKSFLKKTRAVGVISKPTVVISTPYSITEVERLAVEEVTYDAGAKSVGLITEPMAAAVGAGLDVMGPRGSMVVDIGGGTTEVAVISLGGIVSAMSVKTAGNSMDEAIVEYMRQEHQVSIGLATAESLKKNIGSVHESTDRGETEIRGLNLRTGLPVTMPVKSSEIREALREPLRQIVDTILRTLSDIEPELAADIFDYGILLTGGGSMIGGLQQVLRERIRVRVTLAKRPADCVILGLGRVIDRQMEELVDFKGR